MVAGISSLGLGVGQGLAFKVRAGQIVEEDRRLKVEEAPLALDQRRLDRCSVGIQPIEIAVQPIVAECLEIHVPQVFQGRRANPPRHRMLAGRMDQAVERHRAGQLDRLLGELQAAEDLVQAQPFPEVITHMHRPRLTRILHLHPIGVDRDQIVA